MPNALVKKYAERAKCSVDHVEEVWNKAKEIAAQRFKGAKGPQYWAYVNGITQKGLKLKEHSFREFSNDITMADVEVPFDHAMTDAPPPELAPPPPVEPAPPVTPTVAVPHEGEPAKECKGGELVSKLFGARDWAHTLHLKTQSHAMHLALGDLYTDLIELADSIAETTQGKHGLLAVLADSSEFVGTNELGFINMLAQWLETQGRACIDPADTYLLNQLDEVLASVYRAKYKIENLK